MVDGVGEEQERDLSTLVVPKVGAVESTGDVWEPVRLIDVDGRSVPAVTAFVKELQASGRSAATQRSYAMDLLRWFRSCGRSTWRGIRRPGRRHVTSAGGWRCATSRPGRAATATWGRPHGIP